MKESRNSGGQASLKPTTIGVAEYRDETREYIEIAVLNLILRSGADAARLAELVHRAVPYPVLLVATNGNTPEISLAHKRWSQAKDGKTVIDGEIVASDDLDGYSDESTAAFRSSLALDRQRRATLHDLYQGWIDKVEALNAARVTGEFTVLTSSSTEAMERSAALRDYWQLETRIAELHAAAKRKSKSRERLRSTSNSRACEPDGTPYARGCNCKRKTVLLGLPTHRQIPEAV